MNVTLLVFFKYCVICSLLKRVKIEYIGVEHK
jgi:hypothetical protein